MSSFFFVCCASHRDSTVLTHSFPTRRYSDLQPEPRPGLGQVLLRAVLHRTFHGHPSFDRPHRNPEFLTRDSLTVNNRKTSKEREHHEQAARTGDRKSTRLNSSH